MRHSYSWREYYVRKIAPVRIATIREKLRVQLGNRALNYVDRKRISMELILIASGSAREKSAIHFIIDYLVFKNESSTKSYVRGREAIHEQINEKISA